MKVANNTQTNPTPEKGASRNDLDTPLSGEFELDGVSEKPSFANVLDRVTQSSKQSRNVHGEEHSKTSDSTPQARTKSKEEEQRNTDGVVVSDRLPTREPLATVDPSMDVHTILQTEDLAKIVAACRVENVAGRPEVQLDLSHSVLDGLRVKVRVDSLGGVTTEFLAANEGVKNLLDSRSAELIALLRSRGINLVNFRSSLSAATDTGSDSSSRQDHGSKLEAVKNPSAQSTHSIGQADSDSSSDDIARGATYRA
jgi:hypothetical protein